MMPLLVASLEGETVLLGRSLLHRVASKAKSVAKSATTGAVTSALNTAAKQTRNVVHTQARIARATVKPVKDVARGNFAKAFTDVGRAVTVTTAAPITQAAGVIGKGQAVEGFIDRNDPNALLNRKTLDAIKAAIRPIVRRFAGDVIPLGDEETRSKLREQKGKIVAAVTAPAVAAATSAAGPYGGAAAGVLTPIAVDAVIEEIANAARQKLNALTEGGSTAAAAAADAASTAASQGQTSASGLLSAKIAGIPVPLLALGAVGAVLFLRRKG